VGLLRGVLSESKSQSTRSHASELFCGLKTATIRSTISSKVFSDLIPMTPCEKWCDAIDASTKVFLSITKPHAIGLESKDFFLNLSQCLKR